MHGQIAGGNAAGNIGRVRRLAAQLARQPACDDDAQHDAKQRARAGHHHHHKARALCVIAGA
eukprot:13990-Eustigmatos_ZCMA.PRE.1